MLPSDVAVAPRTIAGARFDWLRVPLKVPYELSFGRICEFDVFVSAYAFADGTIGYGETTPLPGYSSERPDRVWEQVRALAGTLAGADAREVAGRAAAAGAAPFATTLLTMPFDWPELAAAGPVRYPLLGTVMSHDLATVESDVRALFASGYTTLKVKVGWDVDDDIAYVRAVERAIDAAVAAGAAPERPRYRIDANQGYDLAGARRFVASLDPARIELFEQPFAPGDWDSMRALGRVDVPLMLDESIDGDETIDRAASLGNVTYVKFKLMKAGGVGRLRQAVARANDRGLKVVLGNGVAADIGCLAEAVLAREFGLETDGEMNGYLKPVVAVASGVRCEGGSLVGNAAAVVPVGEVRQRFSIATL
ncbi:MAG: dipeptide epimerase [Vulcanimicrobiaceae bacterium]